MDVEGTSIPPQMNTNFVTVLFDDTYFQWHDVTVKLDSFEGFALKYKRALYVYLSFLRFVPTVLRVHIEVCMQ